MILRTGLAESVIFIKKKKKYIFEITVTRFSVLGLGATANNRNSK